MHGDRHAVVEFVRVLAKHGCVGRCEPSRGLQAGDIAFEHAHGRVRSLWVIARGRGPNGRHVVVEAGGISGRDRRGRGAPAASGQATTQTRGGQRGKAAQAPLM